MVTQAELIEFFNQLLQPEKFTDYCPNGLQVAGKNQINRLISGVTACQALLDKAVEYQADAILVHHGYFWKGEAQVIVGMKQRRIKQLLSHDINLFAYHLPLDAHIEVGNNVQFAKQLNLFVEKYPSQPQQDFLFAGRTQVPMDIDSFSAHLARILHRVPLHIKASKPSVHRLAWCTGAAQDDIERAAQLGVDAFISGEISERTVHIARELDIHYFACGHHATERYGVQQLAAKVAQQFGIEHRFVDIDNPV